MNNKNEESKRSFVPRTIGDSLKNINRELSNKLGKTEYIIISKWPEIVGSFFADHSEPVKITNTFDGENDSGENIYINFLHVNVSPAAAVEFQHFKDKIIDKINSYFGFKAIVNLRLQQNFISKKKDKGQNLKKNNNFYKKTNNLTQLDIKNINNKELEKSLEKLGQSINEKTNNE